MIATNLIRAIAYKMTGSYTQAQDIEQDIQLKLLSKAPEIQDEKNYLIRMTVNHCLNVLEKENRTTYPGIWLPEPIPEHIENSLLQSFENADTLSYEMLRLLQNLSPSERAVFILKEAFDFGHQEIAEAIGISVDNSRQLLKRAKEHLQSAKHQAKAKMSYLSLAAQYVQLIREGDVQALIQLFNEDINILGDGGGKNFAAKVPIVGPEKAALFLKNIAAKAEQAVRLELVELSGLPTIIIYVGNYCIGVQMLVVHEGKISRIFSQINPDKLMLFHKTA